MNEYIIKLDGKIIGATSLESADVPMGVVTGKIKFDEIMSGFEYIYSYCKENNILINQVDEQLRFIDTQVIEKLD